MREYLPYNVLMVIAVVTAGITLFYNLALRESFSVFIKYEMPALVQPEQEVIAVNMESADNGEDEDNDSFPDEDESVQNGRGEENALTSVTFPVDINKATEEQLRFIPQVGNVTAQRIVQYREVLGGYTELEQLMEIKGISDKAYENISAYLIIADNE